MVDTQGLLLGVLLSEANMGERLAATALVMEEADNISHVELIWADSGYSGLKFQLAFAERCVSSIAGLISARVEIVMVLNRHAVDTC
ncbi:MAG: transposase [Okeania sp. SIO1H6]|nr:transposase [Okeania sp. SIO1H6]